MINFAELPIACDSAANPPVVEEIVARLLAYNRRFGQQDARQELTLSIRDQDGNLVAGLNGHTQWNWLYTRLLWVTEDARSQGLGRKLMLRAHQEARRRGCDRAWIDTFSPQARQFYQVLGYRDFGILDGFPPNQNRYFLAATIK